jgi:hypothetical protein
MPVKADENFLGEKKNLRLPGSPCIESAIYYVHD